MEDKKLKIDLLPHTPFLKEDGTFDKEKAMLYSAKLAGECYSSEGYQKLKEEDDEKSLKRLGFTLGLEHSTPYEHVNIGFEISNVSKILAMVLNNERQCATSEKSGRYTNIEKVVTIEEKVLYTKWLEIFITEIKEKYSHVFDELKIKKLAQENARYLTSVFTPMQMIHTIPWVQLNRVVSFMQVFIDEASDDYFEKRLSEDFKAFIKELERLNLLDEKAMSNRKKRKLSLFASEEYKNKFGYTYTINYKGTFAMLAQAHRHRTLEYSMKRLDKKEYFIPPIIKSKESLVKMWNEDMASVSHLVPTAEIISINETGNIDKFILKAKERLCSAAQLEVANQTKATLEEYVSSLKETDNLLYEKLNKYNKGARCTFPDYKCAQVCNFKEGINLTREV